jgi:hypothetical protein
LLLKKKKHYRGKERGKKRGNFVKSKQNDHLTLQMLEQTLSYIIKRKMQRKENAERSGKKGKKEGKKKKKKKVFLGLKRKKEPCAGRQPVLLN